MVELRKVWRDPSVWTATLVAVLLRVAPWLVWGTTECIRDECIYRGIAAKIVAGEGLTTSQKGWLPAPGYPYLLAWSKILTGSMQPVKALQILVAAASIFVVFAIAKEIFDRKTAVITAWAFALHPTLIFFTTTMWIETIYIFLLLSAMLGALLARRSQPWVGAGGGAFMGLAILFRGIATYLPPVFALAILWPDEPRRLDAWRASVRARWKSALAFVVATVISVAPWSLYASPRQGGFLVSDATVGHVMWLGNNDFPPLTFDYGIGMLTDDLFAKYLKQGRKPCDRTDPPVKSSRCDVAASVAWIRANPAEFAARIPVRCAQFFNPHSFLTRHVRWGYWTGLPWLLKEALVLYQVAFTFAVVLGGTIGLLARGRGAYAGMAAFVGSYTLFASALMYGMTRFRLPLEPIWLVYLAALISAPRETWAQLRASPVRLSATVIISCILVYLMAWYLPTGFPMFW